MAKSYAELQKQIANLQKAAEAARQKEIAGVVDRIREEIAAYGLTAVDLGLGSADRAGAARKRRGSKAAKARPEGDAAFRDAEGNTWSGRGRRPRWVVQALAAGKTLDELRA